LALTACLAASGCSSSTTPSATPAATPNVQPIVVNAGPTGDYFNGAFTSVTICVPGGGSCQTIDGVLVDTGSTGLRVLRSALTLSLPQQTDASGNVIATCGEFQDGFTWGPVQAADIQMAGERASNVPIQIIDGSSPGPIPKACTSIGASENTLAALGANGILGVGLFRQDCGLACTFTGVSNPGLYFACPSTGCAVVAESLTRQLQNPVWMFPTDNNGVLINLPAVPDSGSLVANGSLIFGIGTQNDNALGSAKAITTDGNGTVTTVFNGQSYGSSFIDSGSNGVFFLDAATTGLPLCPDSADFYCPRALSLLSAANRGVNGASVGVSFGVANADALPQAFSAFNNVAGPNPGSFDWGLSFFFGRPVFTAIEGQSTPAGTGPYFAY
jgi:hypothetical protein